MSRIDKLIIKLLDFNKVLTYSDLCKILSYFGYEEKKTGKTSGSRKAFINNSNKDIIRLHKPHPGNEIKRYIRKDIIEKLEKNGLL